MTTLIMVQQDGDVEMGWDSMLTRSNEKHMLVSPKIFLNNGLIFGVSGTLRAADILETTDIPTYAGGNQRHWLIRELTPVLREALSKEPSLLDEDGTAAGWGFMAIVDGQAFQFDSMFNPVQHVSGLYTMGSGGDYARGALMAGASVLGALEVSSIVDPYTGGALSVCLASEYLASNGEHASAGVDGRLERPTT